MARPERNDVDYFPFYCKEGKTMFYIEQKYGNDGFAIWVKLLRALATTNYHYLNLSNEEEIMFLASKCRVSEDVLIQVITDLSKFKEIDQEIWNKHKHVWSEKFIDSISDAYDKRRNTLLNREALLLKIEGKEEVFKNNSDVNEVKSDINPHTILYNTKEKDIKLNKRKENEISNEKLRGGIVIYTPEDFLKEIENSRWLEELEIHFKSVNFKIEKNDLVNNLQNFLNEQKLNNKLGRALGDIKQHFFNTIKKQKENGKTGTKTGSTDAKYSRDALATLAEGILNGNNCNVSE